MFSSVLPLALLALSTLAFSAPTVYLIRHGEKPEDDGTGLSTQGEQRAQCLRQVFGASSGYNIGYIMAMTPKKSGKRIRPYQTVLPLAIDLGLEVDISCSRDDPECVRDVVEGYEGDGNILICWEHDALTDIIEELGADDAPEYPSDRFDLLWTDPAPYSEITAETTLDVPQATRLGPLIFPMVFAAILSSLKHGYALWKSETAHHLGLGLPLPLIAEAEERSMLHELLEKLIARPLIASRGTESKTDDSPPPRRGTFDTAVGATAAE
ncbi:hypothetical protein BJX63DRAFT_431527 [Aspergillus granulosus]|uniref:Phosphoglycerate mutase family protein n=1 Tax=Aspergillus granulosus TaxID=176169 RepID=A0ABR4HFL1_9EURO